MADSIQNVYSTALFELCGEQDCLGTVFDELGEIAKLTFSAENREYAQFLSSPLISAEDKTRSLDTVFGGKISQLTLDFLCLLAEKGRFSYLPQVYEDFRAKYNEKMNILEVTAVTVQPMSAELSAKLKAKLEKVSGKTVVLTEKTDKSILGGIVLKYGNTEINSSVKARLDKLRAQIDNVIA